MAEASEATKRQILLWTESGVLRCNGPLHEGTGRLRDYDESEVRFAKLALKLSSCGLPVGRLIVMVGLARTVPEGQLVFGGWPLRLVDEPEGPVIFVVNE